MVVPFLALAAPHVGALGWLVGGLALCAAEALAPGVFFVWFGLAALIVGAVDFIEPFSFVSQLVLFVALAGALAVAGGRVYEFLEAEPRRANATRNSPNALIGADFFLDEAIVEGSGCIHIGHASLRVTGEDCPAGAKVRVVAVNDAGLLRVERV
jgi:inner membrane protein